MGGRRAERWRKAGLASGGMTKTEGSRRRIELPKGQLAPELITVESGALGWLSGGARPSYRTLPASLRPPIAASCETLRAIGKISWAPVASLAAAPGSSDVRCAQAP